MGIKPAGGNDYDQNTCDYISYCDCPERCLTHCVELFARDNVHSFFVTVTVSVTVPEK